MLCRRCKRDRPGPNRSLFPRQPRSKKNVLALEGGGLRGVFTLTILRKLEQVSGVAVAWPWQQGPRASELMML